MIEVIATAAAHNIDKAFGQTRRERERERERACVKRLPDYLEVLGQWKGGYFAVSVSPQALQNVEPTALLQRKGLHSCVVREKT